MSAFYARQLAVIVILAKFAPSFVLGQVEFSLAVATPVVLFCSLERAAFVADAAHEFAYGTTECCNLMMGWRRLCCSGLRSGSGHPAKLVIHHNPDRHVRQPHHAFAGRNGMGPVSEREASDLMAASAGVPRAAMLVSYALFVPLFAYLRGAVD